MVFWGHKRLKHSGKRPVQSASGRFNAGHLAREEIYFTLLQIDIELVGAIAAHQRQLQRCPLGIDPRRHTVKLE